MAQETTTESRRKILKFAVYTPPALMLMTKANAGYVKETNGMVKDRKRPKNGDEKRWNDDGLGKDGHGPKRKVVKRKVAKRKAVAKKKAATKKRVTVKKKIAKNKGYNKKVAMRKAR